MSSLFIWSLVTIRLDVDPNDIDSFVCLLATLITAELLHELNRSDLFDLQLMTGTPIESLMMAMPVESLMVGMPVESLMIGIPVELLMIAMPVESLIIGMPVESPI